jgi:hypothetical protein
MVYKLNKAEIHFQPLEGKHLLALLFTREKGWRPCLSQAGQLTVLTPPIPFNLHGSGATNWATGTSP